MLVSIITVCYNSEKTISNTIESIINQDYPNIEYIIIDGKSSDNTLNIIKTYKQDYIKVISDRDNGIYDALNKGAHLATGDIIGFLHADDFYPNKNTISNVIKSFKGNNNLDIILGDVAFINKNEEIGRYYSGKNFNFDIGIMPPHPAVFINKNCYEKFGYFNTDYKIASDYDLLFRFIELNNVKYMYSKDIVVHMMPGGVSNKNIFSSIKLNKEIYQIHESHNQPISVFSLFKKIPRRISELVRQ
jgi:glycosyltransferase involved in cell wall biosynthesis